MIDKRQRRFRSGTKRITVLSGLFGLSSLLMTQNAVAMQSVDTVCNVPLFGLVKNRNDDQFPALEDHFYVSDGLERQHALDQGAESFGHVADGTADPLAHLAGVAVGYISLVPMVDDFGFTTTTPLHRVLLDETTERDTLYTTDLSEAVDFRDNLGYDAFGENVIPNVGHIRERSDFRPLFRLFDPERQDHLYTSSETQRDSFLQDGYDLESPQGSVFLSSQKFPMTNASTVFCHGSSAVRNPNNERARFYYQGPSLTDNDTQIFTFDLWTGEYFSQAPGDHLALLMWGDTALEGPDLTPNNNVRAGRGLTIGAAQGNIGICFEYFHGFPNGNTNPNVFDCEAPFGTHQALPDSSLFQFDVIVTVDTIEYSMYDAQGNLVVSRFTDEPVAPVPSGRTDILFTATNDFSGSIQPSHVEIRNAVVNINNAASGIDIDKAPAVQQIAAGDTAQFTITVINTGTVDLSNISISDPQTANCNRNFATLLAGDGITYNCAQTSVTTSFTNIAQVTGNSVGGSVSNSDSADVVVVQPALVDLEASVVQSTVPSSSVKPNNEPVIRTSLGNLGPAIANNVRVLFSAHSENGSAKLRGGIPSECQLQPNELDEKEPGNGSPFREDYICDIPELPPNEVFTLVWEDLCNGRLTPGGPDASLIFETRLIAVDEEDTDSANNQASISYFNSVCTS